MASSFAPGLWEATCMRCGAASPEVRAAAEDDAAIAIAAGGWLGAQPDEGPRQWWCPECRGKLFEGRRRGRKR